MDSESAKLLADFLEGKSDAPTRIFDKYVARLIALAKSRLSPLLQARVDPEDIVQSAYRSFFRKAGNQEFSLKRSGDLWRILAAFTLNKARKRIDRETAEKRDPRRETPLLDVIEHDPDSEEATILIEQLTSFMEGLKPRDRRIFELRLRGEPVDAIAAALAGPESGSARTSKTISTATVRRVLREAKQALERKLFET
jgi:RNA polymerase sigma-70 factor (ECF subfamily)